MEICCEGRHVQTEWNLFMQAWHISKTYLYNMYCYSMYSSAEMLSTTTILSSVQREGFTKAGLFQFAQNVISFILMTLVSSCVYLKWLIFLFVQIF